jgi:hypothetical protein
MQFTIFRGNGDPSVLSNSDRFNRTRSCECHEMRVSFVKVTTLKLTRTTLARKRSETALTVPPEILARANQIIR